MNKIFRFIVLIVGIGLGLDVVCHLIADILWYQEVGYLSEFWLRLKTQLGLWAIALVTFAFIFGNIFLAQRFKHPSYQAEKDTSRLQENTKQKLGLRSLLLILLPLSFVVSFILLQYGQIAVRYWHINDQFTSLLINFEPNLIWQIGKQEIPQIWNLTALLGLSILILIFPDFLLTAIALIISLCLGLVLSNHYAQVLAYFHRTSFNYADPLFQNDISFYVFSLPVWEIIEFWLLGLFLYSLVSIALIYMLSGNSLSQGIFVGFSSVQCLHLNGIGSLLMLTIAFRYWLQRYELLFSTHGVNYGASYTAVKVQLPIYTGLSFLALAIAFYLFWRMLFLSKSGGNLKLVPYPPRLVYGLVVYLLVAAVTGSVLPAILHPLLVQPNELTRERPYIQRTIALTRQAFDLENIEVKTFNPTGKLTSTDLEKNSLTIRNIRLWDTRPLLETNRQLQQIRLYYKFPNADIDRYTLMENEEDQKEEYPLTEKQQVIIAARELDYSSVPEQAKTWINEHLVYTHGYGFTVSPVNRVIPGGLPDYFVKDIGIDSGIANNGVLRTSSDRIRASIPVDNPRIYYGEIADTYVMTGTKASEFDYPSGNDNTYNIYDGRGGISIGSWWRRLVFAETLQDWQILLTQNFTPQTKLLFRRNIKERVKAIAPFLRYDSDPYLVAADAGGGDGEMGGLGDGEMGRWGDGEMGGWGDGGRINSSLTQNSKLKTQNSLLTQNSKLKTQNSRKTQNSLYWVIDAYTTSDRYPYSDPGENKFNYIRNSVKVVIDAYNGSVNFYIADTKDPIIASLSAIFPKMFKSLDDMPSALRNHIRYPVDLFSIQCDRLLSYHMTDAQVFYNREDQWQVPSEIYGSKAQPVQPYYLIMKLPTEKAEEFILLLPFTPSQRTNLIAWLAARSDGEEYGKLLLYEFPKQQLVYGTEQIEALINQDPVISQQISLWNRAGSRVIQGNLLVIPIERSLLYVEPLYLEAEQNSVPTLVRVIVVYQNRIVMAETLDLALKAIFQPEKPAAPAIVRPANNNS